MRFPPTAKAEATARAMIEEALRDELGQAGGIAFGIAGGACGADILFHEVCAALGIPTRLFLALPQDKFQVASVQRGGPDWVERYHRLCERLPTRVLQESEALPRWLTDKPGYDVWQRSNRWMMFNALAAAARNLTLVALYNRERERMAGRHCAFGQRRQPGDSRRSSSTHDPCWTAETHCRRYFKSSYVSSSTRIPEVE
jgi:hypothetical protein